VVIGALVAHVVVFAVGGAQADQSNAVHPTLPMRVLDTRTNGSTVDGLQVGEGASTGMSQRSVQIAGRGTTPRLGVSAVMVNITVIRPTGSGTVTLTPRRLANGARPTVTSISFSEGVTASATTIVGLDLGAFNVFHEGGKSHLAIDVISWFPARSGLSLAAARLADTRREGSTVDGTAVDTGALGAGRFIDVPVLGRAGVPTNRVGTLLVQVTAVKPTTSGFVSVYSAGTARPAVSTLTVQKGRTTNALAVVQPGSGGALRVYNSSGSTHVQVDLIGWLSTRKPPNLLPGARLMDSRPTGTSIDGRYVANGPLGTGGVTAVNVLGRGIPGDGVAAVLVNVTALGAARNGFVAVYPSGHPVPAASSMSVRRGAATNNLLLVPLGVGGQLSFYTSTGMHLVVDVVGWVPGRPLLPGRRTTPPAGR
jgi:hypothetical protein